MSDLKEMVNVREKCGFRNGIRVSSTGRSGDMAFFWKEDIIFIFIFAD